MESAFADLEELTLTTLSQLSDLSARLGLTKFTPNHLHTFLSALFFFLVIHQAFAPAISVRYSESFRKLDRRGRNAWCVYLHYAPLQQFSALS